MINNIAFLIIHPECVKNEIGKINGSKQVYEKLERIIESEKVYLINKNMHPTKSLPLGELEKYDLVYIAGAYHGMCLTGASLTLTRYGIKHKYLEGGFI